LKLTIDNYDGNGPVDYTSAVVAGKPFRIVRSLNAPVTCTATLYPGSGRAVPARNGRVLVEDDAGSLLFTGYVATEPALELAGQGTTGLVYQVLLSAISDDILLSRTSTSLASVSSGMTAAQALQTLLSESQIPGIQQAVSQATQSVAFYEAESGRSWAENAGSLANATRNAWRLMNGTLTMVPVGSVTHALSETQGTLSPAALSLAMTRGVANDVTVCGEAEPSAYVTEFFQGDGTTVLFNLTREPYLPAAKYRKPLTDLFEGPTVNPQLWNANDPGGYLSFGAGGLTCGGGNGTYGSVTVSAVSSLELGGALVLEAGSVLFGQQTTGILNGLYVAGEFTVQDCVLGFQVTQPNGVTTISPLVNGVVSGSSFTPQAGHLYTMRLRFYSNEMQRILQAYYAVGTADSFSLFGSNYLNATGSAVLEVQDTTNGVAGAPVVLYSGSITGPASLCTMAPLNAAFLQCSIGSMTVQQMGPLWVTSTPSGSSAVVRRLGTAAQGADCEISQSKLQFYPLSTPKAGEIIAVSYRTSRRSVARMANAASIATESCGGKLPGTACWVGSVTSPVPRSSADCENAASAILALSTNRAAAWSGKYTAWNAEQQGDVWPGDVLAVNLESAGLTASLVVRTVQIDLSCTAPGVTKYEIAFANDWAEQLAIKSSTAVPDGVWLPDAPQATPPLANLNALTISAVTGSAIQIAAGATPPSGGGFEVRQRDWSFTAGSGADLVLRSPVPNFSIARQSAIEQYYIRMYDGCTPPNYSRFSTAVFVNLPLASS
jgi:hypothetical protein